jgi:rod shape-determining protein MreD
LWFDVPSQALQVFPVFLVTHLLELSVRMGAGGLFPGWSMFISPLLQTLLWPVVSVLLLAPQRRAPDPDKNRPL